MMQVWMRGATIFKGYYKMEEKTKESFPDGDGFLATGDIGRFNPNGTLSIIDRKKVRMCVQILFLESAAH